MLSVSDPALADLVRRLRLGHLGAEHSPAALADVLERLLRERTALAAQLRTLEQIAATPASPPLLTKPPSWQPRSTLTSSWPYRASSPSSPRPVLRPGPIDRCSSKPH